MTLSEATKIVDKHQVWRTWKHEDGGPAQVNPRELTLALNVLLSLARSELRRLRENRPHAEVRDRAKFAHCGKSEQDADNDSGDWRPSQGIKGKSK